MMEVKNKKKSVGLVILIIVLILIILGLIGYICYDKGIIFKKPEPREQVVKNSKDEKEKDLTNQEIIKDLNKKIFYMNTYGHIQNDDYDMARMGVYSFRNDESLMGNIFNNLNDDLKLKIVLDELLGTNKFQAIDNTDLENSDIKQLVSVYGMDSAKKISSSVVEDEYKNYFGDSTVNHKSFDVCFGYIYDNNTNNYYYIEPQCGGSNPNSAYAYINKYTVKGDEAYVYVNYGLSIYVPDASEANDVNIYKDLKEKEIYRENISEDEANNFRINESNYKEFSEYKYTFKKDNKGNYYFVSLKED